MALSAVDLFAGAGGCSTGLLQAASRRDEHVSLTAVNHWPTAVETHTRNHPDARHFCQAVETVDPREAVPSGKLDLLIAAPECTHHSVARGGKPINDQSRASAWHVLRWLELLQVRELLLENVAEFQTWGPLGRNQRPLKSRRGETFRAFVAAIESYGYRVEWKVLNAADYGAATTRRRLFLRASKRRGPIAWPAPTHSKTGRPTLFGGTKRWRAAREVIDWSWPSQSIFARKKPLRPATIRRILEGLRRFGGTAIQPFLLQLTHGGRVQSVDDPLVTVTAANRGEVGVVEPFIVPFRSDSDGRTPRVKALDDPMQTITTENPIGLAEPFLVPYYGENGEQTPRTHAIDQPVPTIPTNPKFALIQPFVLGQQSGAVPRPVTEPVPTVATDGAIGLIEPFLTEYYGNGGAQSVNEPAPTVTTHDRFALVQPVVNGLALDIRFRMLQPHELSAAMSFPKGYAFAGNKGDAIKQIGNAVDCAMAAALCGAILDSLRPAARPARSEVA